MPIVIDTHAVEIPRLRTVSFLEDSKLRLTAEDTRRRPMRDIRGIVLHTTKGIPGGLDQRPQIIRPGFGDPVYAGQRCAGSWSTDARVGGAHLVVDFDGTVACCADLMLDSAQHASHVNAVTIGIEIYQGSAAELYDSQLDTVVVLLDWLTRRFGIQRQIPHRYGGAPVPRFEQHEGRDFFGVYGHRDVSANRGKGDPGDAVFTKLRAAGYEAWDLSADEDKAAWRPRQAGLGLMQTDGVPGPGTSAALALTGRPFGMWVTRPGDDGRLPSLVT